MKTDEFIQRLGDLARLPAEEARRVADAVLRTLSERIGPKEALETAAQLPKELKEPLQPAGSFAQVFDADEFVRRVSERTGLDSQQAREQTRAVFIVLQEAVAPGELEDWAYDLTTDYVDLAARPAEVGGNPRTDPRDSHERGDIVVGAQEFLRRVSDRAGLDERRARRSTDAVLETFGERIADGEARDLAAQLPEPAAEPLLRPGGDPQAIPLDEFVHRIADREGEFDVLAREHARAVLTTVREAVTVDEWDDTMAELPKDYEALLT